MIEILIEITKCVFVIVVSEIIVLYVKRAIDKKHK